MEKSEVKTRRRFRFSVGKLLLLTLTVALLLHWCRPLKTDNFQQVDQGMSRAEVQQLLGGRPGNYGWKPSLLFSAVMTLEGWFPTEPGSGSPYAPPRALDIDEYYVLHWIDDRTMLEVAFDHDGKVLAKHKRAGFSREFIWFH